MKHARVKIKDRRDRLAAATEKSVALGVDSPPAQRAGTSSVTELLDNDDDEPPSGWHMAWDRRSKGTALAILAALLVVVGWWWWSGQPSTEVPIAADVSDVDSAGDSDPGFEESPMTVVVHVVGDVRTPGVVELPAGSRVQDAIDAVGGATKKRATATVNLARVLVDGEQIVVGAQAAQTADGSVSINSADAATLEQLPGVGPVIAERIVQWRSDNGPFRSIEELAEISGIGPAMVDRIKDQVRM